MKVNCQVILVFSTLFFFILLSLVNLKHETIWIKSLNHGEVTESSKKHHILSQETRRMKLRNVLASKDNEQVNDPLSMRITNAMTHNLTAPVPRYLPQFRNPCWFEPFPPQPLYIDNKYLTFYTQFDMHHDYLQYFRKLVKVQEKLDNTKADRLRCLPSIYIIGFSKCGTTDLYKMISHHPEVAGDSASKEPSFWNRPNFTTVPITREPLENQEERSFSDYLDLFELSILNFKQSKGDRLFIDASPSYIWDFDIWSKLPLNKDKDEPEIIAAHLIKHFTPNAKFIIIVRDPTDRLYSGYLYREFGENSNIIFHDLVVKSIRLLDDCCHQMSLRSCLYDPSLNAQMKLRLRVGHYATFIQDWFNVFPREQFFITRLEDYSRNRRRTLREITGFLGIDSANDAYEWVFSELSEHIFNQRRAEDEGAGEMLPKTRRMLNEHYSQSNKQLAELLQDHRFNYAKVN